MFLIKPVRFSIFTQSEIPSGTTEFMQRVEGTTNIWKGIQRNGPTNCMLYIKLLDFILMLCS